MRFENWEKWISAIAKLGAVGSILFFAIELKDWIVSDLFGQ
jgi:hypothetical protein